MEKEEVQKREIQDCKEMETPEKRKQRLSRNRQYMQYRRTAMMPQQRQLERRRRNYHNLEQEISSFNDRLAVRKITKFHNTLLGVMNVMLEYFEKIITYFWRDSVPAF